MWLEVRCDRAGLISQIGEKVPPDEHVREEVFTVQAGSQHGRRRQLPMLYFGRSPIYASRDLSSVVEMLETMIAITREAHEEAFYLASPLRIDGAIGLYARDIFNRSPFRRRLERKGAEFPRDPYVRFDDQGEFINGQWGSFIPAFIVLPLEVRNGHHDVTFAKGAKAAFLFTTYRFGSPEPMELSLLTSIVSAVPTLNAGTAESLIEALDLEPSHSG